jgi:hypothetical protein
MTAIVEGHLRMALPGPIQLVRHIKLVMPGGKQQDRQYGQIGVSLLNALIYPFLNGGSGEF